MGLKRMENSDVVVKGNGEMAVVFDNAENASKSLNKNGVAVDATQLHTFGQNSSPNIISASELQMEEIRKAAAKLSQEGVKQDSNYHHSAGPVDQPAATPQNGPRPDLPHR